MCTARSRRHGVFRIECWMLNVELFSVNLGSLLKKRIQKKQLAENKLNIQHSIFDSEHSVSMSAGTSCTWHKWIIYAREHILYATMCTRTWIRKYLASKFVSILWRALKEGRETRITLSNLPARIRSLSSMPTCVFQIECVLYKHR